MCNLLNLLQKLPAPSKVLLYESYQRKILVQIEHTFIDAFETLRSISASTKLLLDGRVALKNWKIIQQLKPKVFFC